MIKQVIVIRKDLKMRRGKECAQAAHAASQFLLDKIYSYYMNESADDLEISSVEWEWINTNFTKICVSVNSEQELLDIYEKAKAECINVRLIRDLGKTEFKEPTYTCLAIGPDESHLIDKITGELSLY